MKPIKDYKTAAELAELASLVNTARIFLSLVQAKQEGIILQDIFLFRDAKNETLLDALKYELQDNIDFTFTEPNLDARLTHQFFLDAITHIKAEFKID